MAEGETIRYELYAPFLLSEAKFDECFNWSCLRAGLFDASMHATGHYLSTHLEKIYNEKVKLPDLLTIFNI